MDYFSKLPGKTIFNPNSVKFDEIREVYKFVDKLTRDREEGEEL